MASSKLADLTAIATIDGDELLYIVDDPAGTPLDRKVTVNVLKAAIAARVFRTTTQSINTATSTAISFDSEAIDTSSLHEGVTNPTRLSLTAGKWLLLGSIGWASNATGQRQAFIKQDGTTTIESSIIAGLAISGHTVKVAAIVTLAGTGYFELFGYQDSGGSLTTTAGTDITCFSAFKIGA